MGTLLPCHQESIPRTIQKLAQHQIPWVLDPVGLGKGDLHNVLIQQMKEQTPAIIKGNASEIITLAQMWELEIPDMKAEIRGVDTQHQVSQAKEAAVVLAKYIQGAVIVSGPTDLVTDGEIFIYSEGGSPWLAKMTGAGCMLGGVTAVYASCREPLYAALAAVNHFNIAGERAEKIAAGPGTFNMHFIDALYHVSIADTVSHPLRIEEISQ